LEGGGGRKLTSIDAPSLQNRFMSHPLACVDFVLDETLLDGRTIQGLTIFKKNGPPRDPLVSGVRNVCTCQAGFLSL
jgi:hypothetical protein